MKQSFLKLSFVVMASAIAAVVPLQAEDVAAPAATNSPAAANQLSLDDLVNEAMEKNPELKFYQAEIAAAKGGRKTAGSLPILN